jgi:excisionase family DNA binding protein|tara:strand:+ start:2078 stop:2308 length:231 start_codon:yes stop_codon:yes gene_type:complete
MSEVETPYVNINKVADYFKVSVSTIRKWVNSGQIPADTYINIGEVYRFRLDDVEAALTVKTKKVQTRASKTKKDGE